MSKEQLRQGIQETLFTDMEIECNYFIENPVLVANIVSYLQAPFSVTTHSTQIMATRGRIGIKLSDGSILSSLSSLGLLILSDWVLTVKNFNSFQKAIELIDGGDMSACYTTHIWESEPLNKRSSNLMDLLSSSISKTMKVSGFTPK